MDAFIIFSIIALLVYFAIICTIDFSFEYKFKDKLASKHKSNKQPFNIISHHEVKEPENYLDAQEERRAALAIVKDKLIGLVLDWSSWAVVDHPAHMKEREEKIPLIENEILQRAQDYDTFMYDFKRDWDLNYDDYELKPAGDNAEQPYVKNLDNGLHVINHIDKLKERDTDKPSNNVVNNIINKF